MGGSAYSQQQHRHMQRVSSPDPSAASSAVDGDPAGGAAALKLFVQPSFKSNRGIIINAISHCVLAGTVNTDVKNKVLEVLRPCRCGAARDRSPRGCPTPAYLRLLCYFSPNLQPIHFRTAEPAGDSTLAIGPWGKMAWPVSRLH